MDFSESAIIYLKTGPYLITVMTNGTQIQDQTDLVSKLSDKVYHYMLKSNVQ
jgi:hypothetical protein